VEDQLFPGADVASAILVRGSPTGVPAGLAARTRSQSVSDTLRPLDNALRSLTLTAILMLVVAGMVIGSVVYLSALERSRDFAVLKATGCSDRSLLGGLVLQVVVLSLTSALLGVVLAHLLIPLFPLEFTIPVQASVALPAVAVLVGLVASLAGLRRAVATDPALAFGGS
jgi:putative ABC transport system permease protein